MHPRLRKNKKHFAMYLFEKYIKNQEDSDGRCNSEEQEGCDVSVNGVLCNTTLLLLPSSPRKDQVLGFFF